MDTNNNNKPASAADHRIRPDWRHLFSTAEGRILLLGIAIALAGLGIMSLLVAIDEGKASRIMGAMSIANIMLGTIVSMSIGYAADFGHAFVILVNIWIETVMVLLFYPVFVFSMRKLVIFPRLKRLIERTRDTAERHQDKVRRYGIAGLFVFVWFPFWMTGPLVGCAIGYLLGFPAWLTLSVVLSGTFIAMSGWALVISGLYAHAADLGFWAPLLIIALVVLFILAGFLLNRSKKKFFSKRSKFFSK